MPTLPAYVDAGLRERTPHGSKDFPIQYYADELALCPDHTFPLHWHPELEFFVCRGRQVIVQANGVAVELEPGFGILINSNTVHSIRQPQGGPGCHCPNIVFSEELIAPVSSLVYQSYVKPLTGNAELPYILLRPDTPWQGEIWPCRPPWERSGSFCTATWPSCPTHPPQKQSISCRCVCRRCSHSSMKIFPLPFP